MNDLEDRLREHLSHATAHLPTDGPGLPRVGEVRLSWGPDRPRASRHMWLVAGSGVASVVALLGIGLFRNDGGGEVGPTPATYATGAFETAVSFTGDTLPNNDLLTSPLTVPGDRPESWYRIARDVDVAWLSVPTRPEEPLFCWRTPVVTGCKVDPGVSHGSAHVVTAGIAGTTLIIVAAAEPTVTLALSDGTTIDAPVETLGTGATLGVARINLPEGVQAL